LQRVKVKQRVTRTMAAARDSGRMGSVGGIVVLCSVVWVVLGKAGSSTEEMTELDTNCMSLIMVVF